MAGLATRFAHRDTAFIPSTVRYTVVGDDSERADPAGNTLPDRWASAVGQAEASTGITMAAIRPFPGPDDPTVMGKLWPWRGSRATLVRRALAGPDLTLLTSRELFTEISSAGPATASAGPATASAYPATLALTIAGWGDTIPMTVRRDGRS